MVYLPEQEHSHAAFTISHFRGSEITVLTDPWGEALLNLGIGTPRALRWGLIVFGG